MPSKKSLKVAIVGAGPNGLTAAATLLRAGCEVDVYEQAARVGGACVSQDVFGTGEVVDLGAAAHPFGVASPAFAALNLENWGLQWAHAPVPLAHPFDDADTAYLYQSLEETAAGLKDDARAWTALHAGSADAAGPFLSENPITSALRFPTFAARGALPATLASRIFQTPRARSLFLGSAAHAMAPLNGPGTAAVGILFGALGMTRGWPFARGGSGAIVTALERLVRHLGGRIHCGAMIKDVREIGLVDALVLTLGVHQLKDIRGLQLNRRATLRARTWDHGGGAFKVDYLLSEPVPWRDSNISNAGTVHLGGKPEELIAAERDTAKGRMPQRPFTLVCQPGAADSTRGKTVLWAYAHVPYGYRGDASEAVTSQIERFAPGFRDVIAQAQSSGPDELYRWNPALKGGDIAGGSMAGAQALLRMPHRGGGRVYLGGSSTSPGGGVHGMAGYRAAHTLLKDWRHSG